MVDGAESVSADSPIGSAARTSPQTFVPGTRPKLRELVLPAKNSFIGAWFLEDLTVCDGMLDYFATCQAFERAPGIVGSMNGPRLDRKAKDSVDLFVHPNMSDPRVRRYIDGLYGVIEMYKEKFRYAFTSAPWAIESGFNIRHYPPGGGFFIWHTERTCGAQWCVYRHLAFMTYLNDVEDGGETEFFYQDVKVRPQKGLTMFWPSDWTHTHRGLPAPREQKSIVTGWLKFQ